MKFIGNINFEKCDLYCQEGNYVIDFIGQGKHQAMHGFQKGKIILKKNHVCFNKKYPKKKI